jgi:hypothetical protein
MQQSLLLFEHDVFKMASTLAQTLLSGSNNRPFLCRTLDRYRIR